VNIAALLASCSFVFVGCSAALIPHQSPFAKGERVTCHRVTPTGSHLPRRICRTEAQRAQAEEDAKEILAEQQRHSAEVMRQETFRRESVEP
jgi:hypothetical protein